MLATYPPTSRKKRVRPFALRATTPGLTPTVFGYFSQAGCVDKVIMGLHRVDQTPCGFAFVVYFNRSAALAAVGCLNATPLNGSLLKVDVDPGFIEGRQFGRGSSGAQRSRQSSARSKRPMQRRRRSKDRRPTRSRDRRPQSSSYVASRSTTTQKEKLRKRPTSDDENDDGESRFKRSRSSDEEDEPTSKFKRGRSASSSDDE